MKPRIFVPLVTLLFACGDPSSSAPTEPSLETVHSTPELGTIETLDRRPFEQALIAIAASKDRLFAATQQAVFELASDQLVERQLYADPGEPAELGAVFGIEPRSDGGVFIAAETGLFSVDTLYAVSVGLELPGSLFAASETGAEDMAGLWLATSEGILRLGSELEQIQVVGLESAPATQIAAARRGAHLLVWIDHRLFEIGRDQEGLYSREHALEITTVYGMSSGAETIFVAAQEGLFRFDPRHAPAWSRFDLQGRAALGVTVSETGTAYVRTPTAVIEIHEDDHSIEYAITKAEGPTPIALDANQRVWTAEPGALLGIQPATEIATTSFAEDLSPWLDQHCVACHANPAQNFLDRSVFASLAEDALARIARGDMPRCAGGVVCPEAERMSAEEYAVLDRWIRDGKQP